MMLEKMKIYFDDELSMCTPQRYLVVLYNSGNKHQNNPIVGT